MDSYSSKKSRTFLFASFFLIMLFAVASAVGSIAVGRKIDSRQRENLLTIADTAALSIDPELIKALDGAPNDLSKEEYTALKEQVTALKEINGKARFVYLMGLRTASETGGQIPVQEEKLFFFVDSEPVNSDDYSAPGDIYNETTTEEITNYKKGGSFVQGPYEDSWGHWVTAESPIIDPATGTTLAMLGIDVSTEIWRGEILFARIMIASIAALLTIFLLTLYLYLERSIEKLDVLAKSNKTLRVEKMMLTESEEVAGLGRFTLLLGSGTMMWDSTMYALFNIKEGGRVTRELFESLISSNDRPKVKELLNALASGEKDRGIIEYKMESMGNSRMLLSIMKAYRGPDGSITRIVGTCQDVSNRTTS